MLILGIDPGEAHAGWSAVQNGVPIAGGTIGVRGKTPRRVLSSILAHMQSEIGRSIPDFIVVEVGSTRPSTTAVVRAAREFAEAEDRIFTTVRPNPRFHPPRRRWTSRHEKDACRAALRGERQLLAQSESD